MGKSTSNGESNSKSPHSLNVESGEAEKSDHSPLPNKTPDRDGTDENITNRALRDATLHDTRSKNDTSLEKLLATSEAKSRAMEEGHTICEEETARDVHLIEPLLPLEPE